LDAIGMTKYRLHKLSGVSEPAVVSIANGKRRATDDVLPKFATALGLPEVVLKSWRIHDEYTAAEILSAAKELPKHLLISLLPEIDPEKFQANYNEEKYNKEYDDNPTGELLKIMGCVEKNR
jgi:transcriptional regulator with XRE-family HTH domain